MGIIDKLFNPNEPNTDDELVEADFNAPAVRRRGTAATMLGHRRNALVALPVALLDEDYQRVRAEGDVDLALLNKGRERIAASDSEAHRYAANYGGLRELDDTDPYRNASQIGISKDIGVAEDGAHGSKAMRLGIEAEQREARASYERIRATVKANQAKGAGPGKARRKVLDFLGKQAMVDCDHAFKLVRPAINLAKGESLASFVAKQRAAMPAVIDKIERLVDTYPLKDTVIAELVADLDRTAKKPRPHIPDAYAKSVTKFGHAATISWPHTARDGTIVDSAALFAWANYDAVKAELIAQVDEMYADGRLALSETDRKQQLHDARAEMLHLERLECGAIWLAREAGERIAFREDTSVQAILGIA